MYVYTQILQGKSITEAALEAGFSSSPILLMLADVFLLYQLAPLPMTLYLQSYNSRNMEEIRVFLLLR